MSTLFTIRSRRQIEVNNDPQRRCYNGCHFSTELVWLPWEDLVLNVTPETVDDKLKFWRELNDYAVSCRGPGAKIEYEAVPQEELK